MNKITHIINDNGTVTFKLLGKAIVCMKPSLNLLKSPWIQLTYRRLGEYDGPLPKIYRSPCEEDKFHESLDGVIREVEAELIHMTKYCFVYTGNYLDFGEVGRVEIITNLDMKKGILKLQLLDLHKILPSHIPTKCQFPYNINKAAYRTFVARVIAGLFYGFTDEYVWYEVR